jgi:hypothetical protein
MNKRVAVIGQSNAILGHGFVHQLGRQPGVELGNMARLGASPSILLPFFATRDFFAGHDLAIFDIAIVDQGFLWAGAVDPYSIVRWIEHGIAHAHAAGCLPVLLAIPHRAVIPAEAGAPVPMLQQLYRSVARKHGALCFDLFDEIVRRSGGDGAALDAIYSDHDHLSEAFSTEVAERIVGMAERIPAEGIERQPRLGFLPVYDRIALSSAEGARAERLESTLLASDFAVLETGETLTVETGAVERVAGVLLDRAGSDGKLRLIGRETAVKAVGTEAESELPFVAQLVPLLGDLLDRDGSITIEAAEADAAVTEPSWQRKDGGDGKLRLSELLVERRAQLLNFDRPLLPPELRGTDWFAD